MAAPRDHELLEQILALTRAYALRRWGQTPRYLRLDFPDGTFQQELIPPALPAATAPASAPTQARSDNWACGSDPRHTADFRRIYWPGLGDFRFNGAKQAAVVDLLWDAYFDGTDDPERDQAAILRAVDSDGGRLKDLFRAHPAWGTLIVQGTRAGYYRLAELGGVDAGEE